MQTIDKSQSSIYSVQYVLSILLAQGIVINMNGIKLTSIMVAWNKAHSGEDIFFEQCMCSSPTLLKNIFQSIAVECVEKTLVSVLIKVLLQNKIVFRFYFDALIFQQYVWNLIKSLYEHFQVYVTNYWCLLYLFLIVNVLLFSDVNISIRFNWKNVQSLRFYSPHSNDYQRGIQCRSVWSNTSI